MLRAVLIAVAILFCIAPKAAHADLAQCNDPGYLAHFDSRLVPQDCVAVYTANIRWHGGVSKLKVIRPADTAITSNPALIARFDEVAERIGRAMDDMGGLRLEPSVTLIMTNYVSPRVEPHGRDDGLDKGDYVAHAARLFAHECPVTYFKNAQLTSGDEFVFNLAHEVFHCIQYRTWNKGLRDDWLIEGSADYFAYLAKPDFDSRFIPDFDAEIASTPMHRMQYAAVPFFLWIGSAQSPGAVGSFIEAASEDMRASIPEDMWADFAQAYFGQSILMPGGAHMPSRPQTVGTHTFHGTDMLDAPNFDPFTLHQWEFLFDRGKQF